MDDEKLLEITGSMEEKLGKDNFAIISDDIGLLMTGNSENLKSLEQQKATIADLESRNEKLIAANGNLLQRVPMGLKEEPVESNENSNAKTDSISLKDAFDSKGNFIR